MMLGQISAPVDQGWIRDVKAGGQQSRVNVLPRVLFDKWTGQDYMRLFKTKYCTP